jgi:TatD DNase family protein
MLKPNMIFDSHAHYDDRQFEEDRDRLLETLAEAGVGTVVNIGASLHSSEASVRLAQKYPFVYAAVGVHPSDVAELNENGMKCLEALAQEKKVVAIGEIGLDYHYDEPTEDLQKYWFEAQLELTASIGKPVIIHSRDAAKDTMNIMQKYTPKLHGGVIHCFSYSKEIAKEYVDMGYYIGVGGVLTFKNGRKLVEVVENIPLNKIVLETDCPYLAPEPFRGKRNDSTKLQYVVTRMAEILGMDEAEIIRITQENAMKLYKMQ